MAGLRTVIAFIEMALGKKAFIDERAFAPADMKDGVRQARKWHGAAMAGGRLKRVPLGSNGNRLGPTFPRRSACFSRRRAMADRRLETGGFSGGRFPEDGGLALRQPRMVERHQAVKHVDAARRRVAPAPIRPREFTGGHDIIGALTDRVC